MRLGYLFRKQYAAGEVLGNLACYQVALGGSRQSVLIGIFFHQILIGIADKSQNGFVRGVRLADERAGKAVYDILLGKLVVPVCHKTLFYNVLDILDQHALAVLVFDKFEDLFDLLLACALVFINIRIRLANGNRYFRSVVIGKSAVAFNYLHNVRSLS